jgi:hypothetical protein
MTKRSISQHAAFTQTQKHSDLEGKILLCGDIYPAGRENTSRFRQVSIRTWTCSSDFYVLSKSSSLMLEYEAP